MKKFLFTLILFPNYILAQYPTKLFVPPSDTIIAITIPQMKIINISYVKLDECKELIDTLKSIVHKQQFAINVQQSAINNYTRQLQISNDIIKNQDTLLGGYRKLDKKNQTQIKLLKIERNTLAIGALILLAKVFLFH